VKAMPHLAMHRAYQAADIGTLSQRDLIVRMYQTMERSLRLAEAAMLNRHVPLAHDQCTKAKDILCALLCTLNFEAGGEIAERLRDLYLYLINEISVANLLKDAERVRPLIPILITLREGWEQVPDEHANLSSVPACNQGHAFNIRT
jgi:flagellar protein FliS